MQYTSKEVYEYISKQLNDKIVEWKRCRLSGQEFPIYQSDLEFYDKVSPNFEVSEEYAKEFLEENNDVKNSFEYKDGKLKAKIPTPTLCPEEREAQRQVFRNENHLYRRKSAYSGKNIISMISPDKPYSVYEYDQRLSDNWQAKEIGVEKMKEKTFSIIDELLHEVPVRDRFGQNNENSDYVHITENSKNSYMCFGSSSLENCIYVTYGNFSSNCIDCRFIENCENCYECVRINHCFGLKYSEGCGECSNSEYLYNCTGCHDCFNCSDLNNKSYCINNRQYTKEEYLGKLPFLKPEFIERKQLGLKQENCEKSYGNNLFNCKNAVFIGTGSELDNVKYSSVELSADNCYDTFTSGHYCIYTITGAYSYFSGCLVFSVGLKSSRYCINCFNSSYCFGCVGLKNKEYCIYNKQYTKEEYNQIVPQIIAQMIRDKERGEFFDPQISYFGYNESMAMDYHPLSREEALKRGYKWSDYESPAPKVEKFVPGNKLPKQGCKIINEKKPEILEKILNYAVICDVSKKPFRITKQEIEFYVKYNIPLPTKHPDIRHKERFERKDPIVMHLIHCDECGEEMLSVHLPSEGKKILCEKCFYKNM